MRWVFLLMLMLLPSLAADDSKKGPAPFDPVAWRDGQIERWRKSFRDANPLVRRRALSELAGLRYALLDDLAREAIVDDDPRVRIRTLVLIADRPELRSMRSIVLGRLEDQHSGVRSQAARSLERLGPGRGTSRLIEQLADAEGGVRSAVISALRAWTTRRFGFKSTDAEEGRDNAIKRWRAWWVRYQDLGWQACYQSGLAAKEPASRREAAAALARLDDPRSIPLLIERLRDDSAAVQQAAASALYRLSGRDDADFKRWTGWWSDHQNLSRPSWVARLLRDPVVAVRVRAARWVTARDQIVQLDGLISALGDESLVVRNAALRALRSISGLRFDFDPAATVEEREKQAAVWTDWRKRTRHLSRRAWLVSALSDPRFKIRARAAGALARHGDRSVSGHLLGLMSDPSAVVRERAFVAYRVLAGCKLPFDPDAGEQARREQLRVIQRWHGR